MQMHHYQTETKGHSGQVRVKTASGIGMQPNILGWHLHTIIFVA